MKGQAMTGHLRRVAEELGTVNTVKSCRFQSEAEILGLPFREYPHWHALLRGRHIGVHRQDGRICNWVARTLKANGNYKQKCLGPALNLSKPHIGFNVAIERAFEWFETGQIKSLSTAARPKGRVTELAVCPIGQVYTVGHALRDYLIWTKMARSAGGHYNNLTLMNYHLVASFSSIPIEDFNGHDLQRLAVQVLETPPKRGFEEPLPRVSIDDLHTDEVRRRKRTFNSLVTILRMAFQYAWENGHLQNERSWKCLHRISVNHSPRTIFLTREECVRLLEACAPSLRDLVLAGLYTGCRVGELGNLRVGDVADKGFGIIVRAFKNSPSRFVFLPAEGMAFFLRCIEGKGPADHVFHSSKGKPWRRQHTLHFRTAVAVAQLPKEFVFHGLRHTYASDLIRNGASLDTAAKQLGHANTLTVMKTYGHFAEQVREQQVADCFSPLSAENQSLVANASVQLNALHQLSSATNWRDYGLVENNTTLPKTVVARPHSLVLKVFSRPNGRH